MSAVALPKAYVRLLLLGMLLAVLPSQCQEDGPLKPATTRGQHAVVTDVTTQNK